MSGIPAAHLATWSIAIASVAGVIVRPWRIPEAAWAVGGACLLVVSGLLPWYDAIHAIGKGFDVYLFLAGMMLLSELARREGLFDFLAAHAVRLARGSPRRLFLLTYVIGTVVTVFMSNDATAVVLTPAVYAAARKARADTLPFLFACAFIANAASFVLPISNPANLVIFGEHMPPLLQWLGQFSVPSVLAIAATFVVHRWIERSHLGAGIDSEIAVPALSRGGAITGYGIVFVAFALLVASFRGIALGLPTLLATGAVATVALIAKRETPWATLRHVSWGILLLVAGLFVLVQGLQDTGVVARLASALQSGTRVAPDATAWSVGVALALACNLVNNLPLGLIAGSAVNSVHVDPLLRGAVTIAIDVGPNLSVTGSLATILWLTAIRREGEDISALGFLRRGALVMPVALLAALAALWLMQRG